MVAIGINHGYSVAVRQWTSPEADGGSKCLMAGHTRSNSVSIINHFFFLQHNNCSGTRAGYRQHCGHLQGSIWSKEHLAICGQFEDRSEASFLVYWYHSSYLLRLHSSSHLEQKKSRPQTCTSSLHTVWISPSLPLKDSVREQTSFKIYMPVLIHEFS